MLAGELAEIFGVEMTLATGVCDACGGAGPVGELHVYLGAGWLRAAGRVTQCC